MSTTLQSLRDRLARLQALHEGGTLGAEAYAQGREALERQIIERVMAGPGQAAATDMPPDAAAAASPMHRAQPASRLRRMAPLLGGLAVVALVAAGYAWLHREQAAKTVVAHAGSFGAMGMAPVASAAMPAAAPASGAGHAVSPEQIAAMADKLAQRLKDKPDDAEGWAMLARSYVTLGRHAEALPAYAKAVALRGQDAQLLADYADALAVKQGRLLDGEPLKLVQRALQADPDNLKALALAGTAAFAAQDYAGAVKHWERLARVGPPTNPLVQQIQVSIDEARSLGRLPASKASSAPSASGAAKTAQR